MGQNIPIVASGPISMDSINDYHSPLWGANDWVLGNYYKNTLEQLGRRYYDPNGVPTSGPISIGDFYGSRYHNDLDITLTIGKGEVSAGGVYFYGYHSSYNNCTITGPLTGSYTIDNQNLFGDTIERLSVTEHDSPVDTDTLNVSFGTSAPFYDDLPRFEVTLNGLVFDTNNADIWTQRDCEGYFYSNAQWGGINRNLWTTKWIDLFTDPATSIPVTIREII